MRPTSFRLSIRAMPMTIVPQMIGASSMRIRRMKPSPSGRSATPTVGKKPPTITPRMIAITTWV